MDTSRRVSWPRLSGFSGHFAGLVTVLLSLGGTAAHAVSCTTQAEMKDTDRMAIFTAARGIAAKIQAGDVDAVKSITIASVASNFSGIASSIQKISPLLGAAALNVTAVYDLQASDAKSGQDEVEFFCGEAANAPHSTFTIPQLPPAHYAFAIVEATGVKDAQRLSLLLQDTGSWQLAGFFPRPLLAAGHDGVWYWQRARAFTKAAQPWNAYFYYQTAAYLLLPAEFVSSSNFEKLTEEQSAAAPSGLPGAQPMTVSVAGAGVAVTNLHTDFSFGGLDLVVNFDTTDVNDPVAARARTVALMKALLVQHPEWKDGFHGLWVFAHAPNQPPFALELPISEIANQ